MSRNVHIAKTVPEPWYRYRYNITAGVGESGERLSGCSKHIELSRRVAAEGMVLLENNGILPLQSGTTVSIFGIGSYDYVKGGGGSGMVFSAYTRDVYDGLECKAPRITIYEPVSDFYFDYKKSLLSNGVLYGDTLEHLHGRPLMPQPTVPTALITEAATHSDVAVITITRFSGECWDRKAEKGDFYLTDDEQSLVNDVTTAFAHTVVVLDVGGVVDVSWIQNNPKIDAALMAWQAGMESGLAVADILCGDVNPSGKLADTFAKTFADYPSSDTFNESDDYVNYYEDIYVGYRYFETVPGAKDKVVYPFGYGLSYTTFDIYKPTAYLNGENIDVTVSVKNTGDVAGKEVVQVYFSAPQGVLGKSAIELAAFKKSRLLKPGETENMRLSFAIRDMASFDDIGKLQKSAFVLEQGDYRFFVGNSCRNLRQTDYVYTVAEPFVVMEQLTQLCAPNKLEKRMLADGTFEPLPAYPVIAHNPPAPVNPATPPPTPMMLAQVKRGECTLDEFIAQATEDELIAILGGFPDRGLANTGGMGGGMARLGVPPLMTADGPAGVRINPQTGITTTAFPTAILIACTWEPQLLYEIGVAGAIECKEHAFAVWLTPGLNIHRSPLCGRNFEYFSEDPLIAGKFAAAAVRGIQSQHIAATPKHFACNNKETNRLYSDSRVSERALREIYLRGFEICIKESDPWMLMISFNLVNGRRCSQSYEQIAGILRNEWGYRGMLTTDWGAPGDTVDSVLAGTDITMPEGHNEELKKGLADGRILRGHLETCAKRILEMILKID